MTQRHPVQNDRLMFITTNTHDRATYFLDEDIARISIEMLYDVKKRHPFYLHSFVVMPDHWHMLLCVPPPGLISVIMNQWKSLTVKNTNEVKIWQKRFYIQLVDDPYLVINYIHQNPVKAGLCNIAKDYKWSSASDNWPIDDLPILDYL
jgi:putative transposase